jgi:hypothetical protein
MFDELSLNQLLRALYPTVVFLFTVLAWTTAGQGNVIDFHGFPKMPEPTWHTPASPPSSCDANRLAIPTEGSCRIDRN